MKLTAKQIVHEPYLALERIAELERLLSGLQWSGHDVEAGEWACPCCGAWKYQPRDSPIHAYACGLAVTIGAECETPKGMDRGEFVGSSALKGDPNA